MARATNKEGREGVGGGEGRRGEEEGTESEVKKGFPSSYGIYLPSSPFASFVTGSNSDSL